MVLEMTVNPSRKFRTWERCHVCRARNDGLHLETCYVGEMEDEIDRLCHDIEKATANHAADLRPEVANISRDLAQYMRGVQDGILASAKVCEQLGKRIGDADSYWGPEYAKRIRTNATLHIVPDGGWSDGAPQEETPK